jgi:chaperonin GroEL (HSP60 family)
MNLRTGKLDSGILDPTKVVVDAVRDAVSVAVLLTMTNHAVAFNNEALDSFKQKVVDSSQ